MQKIGIIILMGLLYLGCDEKEVRFFPNFEEGTEFTINTSDFEKTAKILASTINGVLSDATEDADVIEEFVLEGIWLSIEPLQNNTAKSIELDLNIRSWQSDSYLPIVEDMNIDIKPTDKLLIVSGLERAGVSELKKQLNAFISGDPTEDVEFEAEGITMPAESTVNVRIKMYVIGTIVFSQTL